MSQGRKDIKIKKGMSGSNGGRNRYEGTEYLKEVSQKLRRSEDKREEDTDGKEESKEV